MILRHDARALDGHDLVSSRHVDLLLKLPEGRDKKATASHNHSQLNGGLAAPELR